MTIQNPDVGTVLTALSEIEREVSGVVRAYPTPPNSITDLPCFINLVGAMTEDWTNTGEDYDGMEGIETRTYYPVLLIAPAASGGAGEPTARSTPFFARVRNAFGSHQNLKLTNPNRVVFQGDGGVQTIDVGGVQYLAIRFTVSVAGFVRIKYAQGE